MRAERSRLPRHADIAKVIDYMLTRRPVFTRFLDDDRICCSNNTAQHALRIADHPASSCTSGSRWDWKHRETLVAADWAGPTLGQRDPFVSARGLLYCSTTICRIAGLFRRPCACTNCSDDLLDRRVIPIVLARARIVSMRGRSCHKSRATVGHQEQPSAKPRTDWRSARHPSKYRGLEVSIMLALQKPRPDPKVGSVVSKFRGTKICSG
jgi:hypothetical protein